MVIIAGLALLWASAHVEILANQPTLSARVFPYILAAILILSGAVLIYRPGETRLSEIILKLSNKRAIYFAALFLIYTLTFRYIDFRIGTWAFMLFAMFLLGARKPLELILLPVFISASVYYLFRYGFTVLLPVWT